jgi:hypothetical protein
LEVRKLFFTKKKRFFDSSTKKTNNDDDDDDEITTESEDESDDRRQELINEEPIIALNQLQLRNLLVQHFNSQSGLKATLANSRLGQWFQRVSFAFAKTVERSDHIEPRFKLFLEQFYEEPAQAFRSFMRTPYEQGGIEQDENWVKLGCFHVTFDMDVTDALIIDDIRIYVSSFFFNFILLNCVFLLLTN